jgi:uncharacterized membrane protein YphA (DoxX/SURF4 family)
MHVIRTGTGLVILAHGINHARGRERTTNWFGSIGFRYAELQWLASTLSKLAIGILLILGLFTGLASAGLIAVCSSPSGRSIGEMDSSSAGSIATEPANRGRG